MSNELHNQIYNELNLRETEDLLEIWRENDHEEWSDTAFEVIKEILSERLGEVPPQELPRNEQEKERFEDDGLDEWEAKVLDNESQPEFYDTLEVLELKDNINRVATGVIVVYTLLGLLNLETVSAFLRGLPIPFSETIRSLPHEIYTLLAFGLQIVVTYFPLKALSHILRILMEMEFRSRKAN